MVIISQIVTVITNDSHFLQKGWTTTAWFCSSAMLSVFDFKRAEGGMIHWNTHLDLLVLLNNNSL